MGGYLDASVLTSYLIKKAGGVDSTAFTALKCYIRDRYYGTENEQYLTRGPTADASPTVTGTGTGAYATIDVTWTDFTGAEAFVENMWLYSSDGSISAFSFDNDASDWFSFSSASQQFICNIIFNRG